MQTGSVCTDGWNSRMKFQHVPSALKLYCKSRSLFFSAWSYQVTDNKLSERFFLLCHWCRPEMENQFEPKCWIQIWPTFYGTHCKWWDRGKCNLSKEKAHTFISPLPIVTNTCTRHAGPLHTLPFCVSHTPAGSHTLSHTGTQSSMHTQVFSICSPLQAMGWEYLERSVKSKQRDFISQSELLSMAVLRSEIRIRQHLSTHSFQSMAGWIIEL